MTDHHFFPINVLDPQQWEILEARRSNSNILGMRIEVPGHASIKEIIQQIAIDNCINNKKTLFVVNTKNDIHLLAEMLNKVELNNVSIDFSLKKSQLQAYIKENAEFDRESPIKDPSVFSKFILEKEIIEKQYLKSNHRYWNNHTTQQLVIKYLNYKKLFGSINPPKIELNFEHIEILDEILKECFKINAPKANIEFFDSIQSQYTSSSNVDKNFERLSPILKSYSNKTLVAASLCNDIITKYIKIRKQDISLEKKKILDQINSIKEIFSEKEIKNFKKPIKLSTRKSFRNLFKNKSLEEKKAQFNIKLDRLITKTSELQDYKTKELNTVTDALKEINSIEKLWIDALNQKLIEAPEFIETLKPTQNSFYQLSEEIKAFLNPLIDSNRELLKKVQFDLTTIKSLQSSLQLSHDVVQKLHLNDDALKRTIVWKNYLSHIPTDHIDFIHWYLQQEIDSIEFLQYCLLTTQLPNILKGNEQKSKLSFELILEHIQNLKYVQIRKALLNIKSIDVKTSEKTQKTSLNKKDLIQEYGIELTKRFPIQIITKEELIDCNSDYLKAFDEIIIDGNISKILIPNCIENEGIKVSIFGSFKHAIKTDSSTLNMFNNNEQEGIKYFDYRNDLDVFTLTIQSNSWNKDLIEFHSFYFWNRNLTLIPDTEDSVIEFNQIDGLYNNNINKREAEKIVELLLEKDLEPFKNIGIYSATNDQRYFLEMLINKKIQEKESFKKKLNKVLITIDSFENLNNNIHDLVILSITFGNTIKHTLNPDFGPISDKSGEHIIYQLSKIAKKQLIVYNSIRPSYYSKWGKEKVKSNKLFYSFLQYLQFAAEGSQDKIEELFQKINPNTITEANIHFDKGQSPNYILNIIKNKIALNYSKMGNPLMNHYLGDTKIDLYYPNNKLAILLDIDSNPLANFMTDLHKQKVLNQSGNQFIYTWSEQWFKNEKYAVEEIIRQIKDLIPT